CSSDLRGGSSISSQRWSTTWSRTRPPWSGVPIWQISPTPDEPRRRRGGDGGAPTAPWGELWSAAAHPSENRRRGPRISAAPTPGDLAVGGGVVRRSAARRSSHLCVTD